MAEHAPFETDPRHDMDGIWQRLRAIELHQERTNALLESNFTNQSQRFERIEASIEKVLADLVEHAKVLIGCKDREGLVSWQKRVERRWKWIVTSLMIFFAAVVERIIEMFWKPYSH